MVLTVYGSPFSTCTARVVTVLKEYNVPYELKIVDLSKGEHKSESYVKIQPFGQIPYIVDNGFVLYESRAIARYIAVKYRANISTPLLPDPSTEPEKYAKYEQAASVETFHFDKPAYGAAFEYVFKA